MYVMIIAHFTGEIYEEGNCRFHYLARMLNQRGHRVSLVTSSFCHGQKTQRECKVAYPYEVVYIDENGYKKNVSVKRIISHVKSGRSLEKYLNRLTDKPDVIYCAFPSISYAKEASDYARKNNIRFIIDVQDIWPEAFKMVLPVPIINDIALSPITIRANGVYSEADAVVAVSETYTSRARKVNTKASSVVDVFLGTDLPIFDSYPAKARTDSDRFRLAYAGTFGKSYDLKGVIRAVKCLPDDYRHRITFVIMGSGPLEDKLRKLAKAVDAEIVFTGRLNYPDMVAELKACDAAINPFVSGASQSITNKVGDYASAGLPVINTLQNEEYIRLLKEYEAGITCDCRADSIARAIKSMMDADKEYLTKMGKNSRRLAEDKFDRATTYTKICEIIEG